MLTVPGLGRENPNPHRDQMHGHLQRQDPQRGKHSVQFALKGKEQARLGSLITHTRVSSARMLAHLRTTDSQNS